jgi:uncharacterized delta-60 repeat protein
MEVSNMMRNRSLVPCFLAVLFLTLSSAPVLADPFTLVSETTWGGTDSDIGETVASGSDGSTYVAGRTRSFTTEFGLNVFVLKFAPDGSLGWQRTWDIAGAFGDHEPHDLAVAADGSAYVAGRTPGVGGDAFLLKFDSAGSLAWQRTWGGSGHESAEGVAVAADGTVFLAGSTQNSFGPDAEAFLVRFASDGSILWQKRFGTAGDDGASDVVLAADGDLFLTGGTPVPGTFGFYIAKVTSDGNVIWQTTYTAEAGVDPRGGLAAGPDGSVVVAAAVFHLDFDLDAAVIRFDAGGNLDWERSWGGRDGDDPEGVAVAADGTVFLAGSTASFGVAPDDAFLVKLLSNGRGKDASTWGGTGLDKGHDAAIAPDGTIVISGTAEAPPYQFLRASSRTSRLRGTLGVSSLVFTDVVGNLLDPGGVVATPTGSLVYAGGFDAALLKILP